MADPKIKLKRSATAGKRPTLANLDLGELALNTYDGTLYVRQDTSGVGIATTVRAVNPWSESFGAGHISYSGNVSVTGILTAATFSGQVNAGVGTITTFSGTTGTITNLTSTNFSGTIGTITRLDTTNLNVSGVSTFAGITTHTASLFGKDASFTGIITASDGRLIAGVGVQSTGTYIGSGVTTLNFIGSAVSSITTPSAGISTIKLDFTGLTGVFEKNETRFTATEGQTSFSVNYEVGYLDVFLNGVRLASSDYTATNGTTVGISSSTFVGDDVDIVTYRPKAATTPKRSVTNATASAGQTSFTVSAYDKDTSSIDVFYNGIKLDSSEFTEINSTTVGISTSAKANDILQFISHQSDLNFWTVTGSTLHRQSVSGNTGIGTTNSPHTLTVGAVGASGTTLLVRGNVTITGSITKGSGTFAIPHPVVSEKQLVHSFIEGPKADLIYRGKTALNNGISTIHMDEAIGLTAGTWAALCRDPQVFLQNNQSFVLVKGSITSDGILTIVANKRSSDEIDWMIIAERQDDIIKNADWTDEDGKPILEPAINLQV